MTGSHEMISNLLVTSLGSAVFLLLPSMEVSISFLFLGSLTMRDRFPLSNLKTLCPSLCICAQMYIVNQGFGTSAAKGAHVGHQYPHNANQSEPIFLLLLSFKN